MKCLRPRNKEAAEFIVTVRDVLNEHREKGLDRNIFYEFFNGFRRFLNDALQNKEDVI